jgi:signal transduction histidine kinase
MSLLQKINGLRLRTKFVLPISVILTLSIGVISAYLIQRQSDSFQESMENRGEAILLLMALQAESGVLFESKFELDELLSKLSVFEDVHAAMIYNLDGDLLSRTGQWNPESVTETKSIADENSHHEDEEDHEGRFVSDQDGNEFIELTALVQSRTEKLDIENLGITSGIDRTLASGFTTEVIGSITIVLDLSTLREDILAAQKTAMVLVLVVAVLTIFVVSSVVRYITRPIGVLLRVTDQVSQGDLTRRVELDQDDEIGQLGKTFNKMIESLQLSRDEIEVYNRTLEDKIIKGTLKLEEAQAQLVQSEKMSAIGQLAAGVAHELNNPLGGILGYAQFTLEKMKKQEAQPGATGSTKTYIKYLTDIETQARRCKAIVQNLLRFSRSSRNTEFDEIDINAVIQDTITFVEHQLHMSQIELELELDPEVPILMANGGQLQQVFTNLIINAMHASPAQSTIEVKSHYSKALGEFGGTVELMFHDHGSGISSENLNKIFEPFFTTKEVGKGTGLGLSVSYGIIKEHGGEIRVDSKVGQHTTFTIILPVQKPSDLADENRDEVSQDQGITGVR